MRTSTCTGMMLAAIFSIACRTETRPKPAELSLQAVHIADGDTFEGRDGDKTYRIRLHGVDAPEKGQDFSRKSRETLGRLCKNGPLKAVVIRVEIQSSQKEPDVLNHGPCSSVAFFSPT